MVLLLNMYYCYFMLWYCYVPVLRLRQKERWEHEGINEVIWIHPLGNMRLYRAFFPNATLKLKDLWGIAQRFR